MPRKDIDYSKTIIYKIVSRDLTVCECYVGSTTDFRRRKSKHKSDCNNQYSKYHNLFVYQFIRKFGGWDAWDMIQIEKYPCNDKQDALDRMCFFVERLNAKLNTNIPGTVDNKYKIRKLRESNNKYNKMALNIGEQRNENN